MLSCLHARGGTVTVTQWLSGNESTIAGEDSLK